MTSEPTPIRQPLAVSSPIRWPSLVFILLGFLFLAIFPRIAGPHFGSLMLTAIGYSIALLGLNLLLGYTGLLALGHAMFLAIGAYTAAYLMQAKRDSLELILLAASFVGIIAAVPIGLLCVRYVKIYFSMLTLAFSMLLYSFLFKFYHLTGGDEGLRVKVPTLLGQSFAETPKIEFLTGPLYYYALALLALLTFIMARIVRSPFGLQLRAIRENEQKAAYLGVSVRLYRFVAFVIAAVYGVIGGVFVGIQVGLADPTLAYWVQSGNLVFMLLLGGYTNFFGPLVGAVVFIFLQDQLMSVTEYWRFAFGALLAVIVIFFPTGLMGLLDRRGRWSA